MSWAANNSFSKPAVSPRLSSPVSKSFASISASGTSLSSTYALGASSVISIAAAGSSDLVSSDFDCSWGTVSGVAPSCCGVRIIANRLANRARASASAPRFKPGVSPLDDRFRPAPTASIVFINMPHSLVTTDTHLSAKREILTGALQKWCQSHLLLRPQRRRRGGIEASKRASRASWRARSSASLRSTARECLCLALAASRR